MNRKSLRPLLRPRTSQLAISKPNLVIKKINEADLSYKKSIAFSGIAFKKALNNNDRLCLRKRFLRLGATG